MDGFKSNANIKFAAFISIAVCLIFNSSVWAFGICIGLAILWCKARYQAPASVTVFRRIDTVVDQRDVQALPGVLCTLDEAWIASLERATKVIPRGDLLDDLAVDELLVRYLRTNMRSFSWTPQGLLFWICTLRDPAAVKETFTQRYLESCGFEVGTRVCGVFCVAVRSEGRIELVIEPPASLRWLDKNSSKAIIAARVEVDSGTGDVTFVNGEW